VQNFNAERLKLFDAVEQQTKQIESLKEDLQRYKAKAGASDKYIFFKSQQIKVLESTLETVIQYSVVNDQIFSDQQKEIRTLQDQVFRLEGISILHGISNLFSYMQMKKEELIALVKTAYTENWRQTPIEILNADTAKAELKRVERPVVPFTDLKNKALENLQHGKETNPNRK
jgi:hypothetical protein